MPKKQTYEALIALSSLSKNKAINPGETFEADPDDVKILLDQHAIKEVVNGTNNRVAKLGELQDRTD